MYRCEKHQIAGDEQACPKCNEDSRSALLTVNCPWCDSNNWKRCMFGIETNYHTCLTCFANTPPRRTIEETEKDVQR